MVLKNFFEDIFMKLKSIIFLLSLNCFTSCEISEPYRSITVLPVDLHGWFGSINQKYLKEFIRAKQPKIVVELGSWLGLSTIFMASHLTSGSKIYAVDHWAGSREVEYADVTKRIPTLFQQFLSNCIHHKQTETIIPVRMDTLEAARALNVQPDLIYIDAAHTEIAVFNDIINWYPKLKSGGICCGDDWDAPTVQSGVKKAATLLGVKLKFEGNFWYFDPKN